MSHYNQPVSAVLSELNTTLEGLSNAEFQKRLAEHGSNALQGKKKVPTWLLFLHQFKDFMILILMVAAIISGVMGDITDTIIILLIILLNAIVGFVQEYRAEKSMEALQKMTLTNTQVIRDGQPTEVSATQLVPGDIVVMEAGNIVPADMRLLEANILKMDEASLTGESVAVDKISSDLVGENISLGDQLNMAFKGTLVTNGRGKGVVVATGMKTELGKIAGMLQGDKVATPLQKRMAKFSKNLSYIILAICLVFFIAGLIRGEEPFKILLLAISLAVAAIPEALPALITIALSKGAGRLAKKKALVRKLHAVETLGSVTFICTDKTGTLTQNKMRATEEYEQPDITEIEPDWSLLKLSMALNHDIKFDEAQQPFGEPTELALVEKVVLDKSYDQYLQIHEQYKRVAELPFDSDRKCMTTVHHFQEKYLVLTKGATESLNKILKDENEKNLLQKLSDEWATKGMRVLAYSYRIMDTLPEPFVYETVELDMQLAGVVGLIDPPREGISQAIQECKTAGIKTVMITGDHPETAKAIAEKIGILDDKGLVLTGAELQAMDEKTFLSQVEQTVVYARVSPDQKLRIVQALQQLDHFVAMTGDGVNDAPSLKAANIGVAMGITGTDVSKEASDLILLDDNFETIVKSVKEGRRIFDNIRKFVKYIMTCNSAEIWTIFLAPFLGLPIPLLPIHILWINLVTDGLPALALASEKAELDVMQRPPRTAKESLFSDGVGYHIIWVGILMAGVTLGIQAWAIGHELTHWQTMVFTVLSLSQLGHVLGVRSDRTFLYKQGIFSNLQIFGAVFLTFLLQMSVVYLPFMNDIFRTKPLSLQELGICLFMSMIVFHAVEFEKWVKMRFVKKRIQHKGDPGYIDPYEVDTSGRYMHKKD